MLYPFELRAQATTFFEDYRGRFRKRVRTRARLILERNHGLVATAERCHLQQAALSLRHGHYGPIAVNSMAVGGKVPAPSLWLCGLLFLDEGGLGWGQKPGDGKGQYQG